MKRYISWYDNEITSNKRSGHGTTGEDMPELVDLDERMRDLCNFAKLFPPITSALNIT